MTSNIGQGRVLRVCDLCGGVDDHPRHVIAGDKDGVFAAPSDDVLSRVLKLAPADQQVRLVRELVDTASSDRHMDCCRAVGCPDGTCNAVTAGAEDKTGKALLTHLTKGA